MEITSNAELLFHDQSLTFDITVTLANGKLTLSLKDLK